MTTAAVVGRQPMHATGGAVVAFDVLLAAVIVAALAPWIAPFDPRAKVGAPFTPPGGDHWLGLDDGGHDMLSLLLYGARVSLLVGFTAAVAAILMGALVGLVAGYKGGRVDSILMGLTDYLIALPALPLMIVLAAVWGSSLTQVIVVISLLSWTTTARVVRSECRSIRERGYVRRARSLGASSSWVVRRHILPQLMSLLLSYTVLGVSSAIFAEAALAFLGLGDPSVISWGLLIQHSFTSAAATQGAWWTVMPPGICIAGIVLACSVIGRSIEQGMTTRHRSQAGIGGRFSIVPPSSGVNDG